MRDKAKASVERNKFNVSYEGYSLMGDKIRKGTKTWPVAGAVATLDEGVATSRRTATRVITGGVVGLGVGAVVGGMIKKKTPGRLYIAVTTTGGAITFDVPAKDEAKAREFVTKVNGASAMFAAAE